MVIWLNGGFGAGKTTLAEELHERLPDAVVYDPEDVGAMLWKWLPRNDDFQDLRGAPAHSPATVQAIRDWAFTRVDAAVAAAARQPEGTLLLRSDQLSPTELAERVLAAVRARQLLT